MMIRAAVALASILALASPLLATDEYRSSPQALGPALTEAARSGEAGTFLVLMSASTRRAMEGARAAQSSLIAAQNAFYAAVAERFGAGHLGTGTRFPQNAKAALSRFAAVEVTRVEHQTPQRVLLQLRTTVKQMDGRTTTENDTFPAVQESGRWRLDLSDLYRGLAQRYAQHEAAYRRVTQEVRAGALKDRVSAGVALLLAWRGLASRGIER
jgi:hypothetical protein